MIVIEKRDSEECLFSRKDALKYLIINSHTKNIRNSVKEVFYFVSNNKNKYTNFSAQTKNKRDVS